MAKPRRIAKGNQRLWGGTARERRLRSRRTLKERRRRGFRLRSSSDDWRLFAARERFVLKRRGVAALYEALSPALRRGLSICSTMWICHDHNIESVTQLLGDDGELLPPSSCGLFPPSSLRINLVPIL